jgi:hypothetical protein
MGALPQALEFFFEVKMKNIIENNNNNKISNFQNVFFLFFLLFFGPLILSNLIIFLFLIHFKRFKVL